MSDSYIYGIVALLPLTAVMLTIQVNPYRALVMRGILGAVAALVYAILGAADVALTEALVGTMLAITLYAVAVRSSLVIRIGVLKDRLLHADDRSKGEGSDHPFADLTTNLRTIARKYHLRLELVPYPDPQSLYQALIEKEVHATCIERWSMTGPWPSHQAELDAKVFGDERQPYQTATRIRCLHEIFQTELPSAATSLVYVNPSKITASDDQEKHA
jgi:putative multicomponent Na+:H+ antiporter subunit B